jgi:aldehyde:ferredoxin oxidoreductase
MSIVGGYWGKILWVDLSAGRTWVETFDDDFARKWLGGVGFATKIVADHVDAGTDPLDPENVLVFATGPFQAAKIASAGRLAAGARSPLTGYWGESNAGGHAGPALKRAGFDAIAIVGEAEAPLYLYIRDGEAELRDAADLWGQADAAEVVDLLKERLDGRRTSVLAVGGAAEKRVRYAVIANDKHGYFGRTGMGTVMGAKRLKAIAIEGSLNPPIAHPERLQEIYRPLLKKILAAPFTESNREHGMPGGVVWRESNASMPMKNWRWGEWAEGAAKIGAPYYTDELQARPWPCEYCVMGCHRKLTNPEYAPHIETGGPEYETLAMLGANLLIDDLEALVEANDLCNRYGMDTIELGGVLAWAFEAYERGWLPEDATDVELTWGNAEALLTMVERTARREGLGDLLAQGLRACVAAYPPSKEAAVEVMGQAVAGHDPRAFFAQTITTIASTRGSCHLHGFAEAVELGTLLPELGIDEVLDRFETAQKGHAGAIYQDIAQLWNALVMCNFYPVSDFNLTDVAEVLGAITGWEVTPEELQVMGERIVALQHLFNLRMGLAPEVENVMPERLRAPLEEGGSAGQVPPWEEIRAEYWATKGWPGGVPTREKLAELGLEAYGRPLKGT